MNWQELKESIYFLDGSLRDIYVNDMYKTDWQKWADFVNNNYNTLFHNYETELDLDKIDIGKVFAYWEGNSDNFSMASVFIDGIKINFYFNDENLIDSDITPKEINSIEDHHKLIKFMTELSNILDKEVMLTLESTPECILISVKNNKITY